MKGYTEFVRSRVKSGTDIAAEMTGHTAHLNHMALGIAGESGELVDAIKKFAIYNKPLNLDNVVEELGDLEFYMEGLRDSLGITREETIQKNIEKLSRRYENGYSDKAAQDRADKQEDIFDE